MSRKKIKSKVHLGTTSQKKNLADSLQKATAQVESLTDLKDHLIKSIDENTKLVHLNQELLLENERLNEEVSETLEEHHKRIIALEKSVGIFDQNKHEETA